MLEQQRSPAEALTVSVLNAQSQVPTNHYAIQ